MIAIARTGSPKVAAGDLRALVAQHVPEVAAKALTFTAQRAQKAVIASMSTVFDRPTRYTLNSTRIAPAKPAKLSARVAVKDRASAGSTVPQDYLDPGVHAGARNAKRFERAFRYAGLLAPGQYVVLGAAAPLDAAGNLKRAEIGRILREATGGPAARKSSAKKRRSKKDVRYFIPRPAVGRRGLQPGIWQDTGGRKVQPILLITDRPPRYRSRLEFERVAQDSAQAEFRDAFGRAWRATIKQGSRVNTR